ncbi:MAG: WecB/TagA/CpsF family glycosyltransferase [Brasilonema octagenarum HA4186-MV1]|uniref:Glycosyltransferase n=1 Tax=Brasilonema sennae CENA114 TaxID=415709 RepID=A0A856MDY0_9CYAN|nr:WecB/TagA/CpsF family glycosyltransferase [Brasilonema sennae]MBW4624042.1 WecB/TagA/CpsF family glycosyltransferase [Brasilonema octagenarum HA4186-MV1]QDL08872.1 glycosyltransferase [Brasilonema sennae CENA114]QDL15229.1 glycosyltransferase [Brasilonema octagenarum UFV-E1]
MNKVKILNLEIDNLSKVELLDKLRSGVVFTPNVDHLMKLQEDPEFLQAYSISDYKICDSQILLYASKFLGTPIQEKISGSDLFPAFYNYHKNNQNIKIFLLGAGIGVASKAQNEINRKTGRNIIVASYSPPFGFEKDEEECQNIINMINSSGATVLVIGVGAPKQEKWIYKYKSMLPHIKIFMALGATIDFEAGKLKRSPKWMSEVGFEWLFRILCDPKRLWKRYLVDDIPFFILILKQKFKFSITKEHKKKNPMSANC